MEIRAEKLKGALDVLEPVVPRKPRLPVLTHILFRNGMAVATDLTTRASVRLEEVVEPLLLPGKQLYDILRFIPGYEVVRLKPQPSGQVVLEAGDTTAILPALPAGDFPPSPNDAWEVEARVDGDALLRGVTQVAVCAATESSRPVLNAVCLTAGPEVEAAAADGFRLSWIRVPVELPTPDGQPRRLLIPADAVSLWETVWKRAPKPLTVGPGGTLVDVAFATRHIQFAYNTTTLQLAFGAVAITFTLIAGDYINYRQIVPTRFHSRVSAFAEDLALALRRVGASAPKAPVRLRWDAAAARITVGAAHEDAAVITMGVKAKVEGAGGKTALSGRYLADYLKGKSGPMTIDVLDESSPVLLSYPEAAPYVLMPMFVSWDGDGKAEGPRAEQA